MPIHHPGLHDNCEIYGPALMRHRMQLNAINQFDYRFQILLNLFQTSRLFGHNGATGDQVCGGFLTIVVSVTIFCHCRRKIMQIRTPGRTAQILDFSFQEVGTDKDRHLPRLH